METIKEQKESDYLEMKRGIQAKIYSEKRDVTTEKRITCFHIPHGQDPFRQGNNTNEQISCT